MSAVDSPRSAMTLRGAFLISAAAVALLIGIARADGALAAIGFLAFLFVPICAWLGKRNLRDLHLHCQAASRTYAGQPFPAQLRMELTRVTGAAHSVAVHLQLPGQGTHTCEFASVIAETVAIQDVIFELPRRGKSNDIPFLLESEFPLGLWKHSRPGVMAHALCVYPRCDGDGGSHLRGDGRRNPRSATMARGRFLEANSSSSECAGLRARHWIDRRRNRPARIFPTTRHCVISFVCGRSRDHPPRDV